ncbi:hypothetical protein [Micromonospora sp. L31]|uniref:hypothetical protein n=1 Tax=Micromonospora sp. L31 TaxID=3452213 RepID=UPI003F8CC1AD
MGLGGSDDPAWVDDEDGVGDGDGGLFAAGFAEASVQAAVAGAESGAGAGGGIGGFDLEVEYRDVSGARLDTDTAYVGSVPAGDTVRGEESTFLNASPGSGTITCKIVKVS